MRCSAEKPNMRRAYFFLVALAIADPRKMEGLKPHQLVTGVTSATRRAGWDRLYDTGEYVYGTEPAAFVVEALNQIRGQVPRGRALDIAAGEGRNAAFLAQKGFHVEALDFSEVALRKAQTLAQRKGVRIKTVVQEVKRFDFRPNHYDLIVNINFLERDIVPSIVKSLKKGGALVFENHTVDQLRLRPESIPKEFLLEKGELRELFRGFPELEVLIYRETQDGRNALASLLAVKR